MTIKQEDSAKRMTPPRGGIERQLSDLFLFSLLKQPETSAEKDGT